MKKPYEKPVPRHLTPDYVTEELSNELHARERERHPGRFHPRSLRQTYKQISIRQFIARAEKLKKKHVPIQHP